MDQSNQNTPTQDDRAIQDSEAVVATPGLGLAKGIIVILLGVVELVIMSFTVRDLANRR